MAFDPQAYLAANPDVAASGMSPEYHYQNFGQYEGRDPGGATSGAQSHYWDSAAWAAQPGNAGGTSATGIQSSTTAFNPVSGLPTNASFYVAPGQFGGQNFNVNLTARDWANVQRNIAGGMDPNEAIIRASGDGLGSARIIHDAESGYLPYGVDVVTGRPTTANASYSQTVNGGLSSGMYGASTSPSGAVTFPGGVGVSGNSQALGGSGVGAASGVGGGSGSGSGGLVQGVNVNQYNQNPYLAQMGTVLTNRVTDNLQRQIMPSIRSNAVAAGGFGGSRQGVVEANAMKDANQTISDALTGAYFQDFTNQMNRNLAQYGQNQNFFSNQRGQDLQQLALGANLFQQGNQGWLSQGQGLLGLGQTQQQAPWQVINNANAGLGQWSGYGTTTSANQGGGAQGVLGGAMAGGQLGSLWGGAGINSPVSTPQPLNANYSLSTGGGLGLRWPS